MNIAYETNTRIRYAETDQMGFAHHGNYAQFLEMGRIELLRNIGVSYKEMEERGCMLPVITLHIDYKKSAYYDNVITIKTMLTKMPEVRIAFDYEITNEKGELLATAHTVLVFVNMITKRPMKCPEYIKQKLEELL